MSIQDFNNGSRRSFFSTLFKTAAVVSLLPGWAVAERRRAPRGGGAAAGAAGSANLPWAKATDAGPSAVNYHASYKDVKEAKHKIERSKVAFGPQQVCSTCTLYTAAGKKDSKDAGKCTLFANALVPADAWCSSWTKKA